MKTNNYLEIFERLKPLGITTQQQLAKALGITQSAVADAKRRGSFPKGWAVDISQAYNISLNALLQGGEELPSHSINNTGKEEEEMWKDKYILQMELNQKLQTEISELKDCLLKKAPLPTKKLS